MYKKVLSGEKELSVSEDSYHSWKNHAQYCTDHSIFNYYENRLEELRRKKIVIENGYYISDRTSIEKPYAYIDLGTLYLPFDIESNEEEGGIQI